MKYTLKVVSWENDGDYYQTKEHIVNTKEEADFLQNMCNELFKSDHGDGPGISNECEDSIGSGTSEGILDWMELNYPEKMEGKTEDQIIDMVSEIGYNLLGNSEWYSFRVCESCEVISQLKNQEHFGMNPRSDRFLLPPQYQEVALEPYYSGDGNHSVKELEKLCRGFKEYCHQQAIIKQRLIEEIKAN